jgi:long-chain fatty acid transport protein
MKLLSRLSLVLVLAASLTTGLMANGLNLNGFGARATAMGGAYVSLANDYTSVFWNPAGLAEMTKAQFGLDFDALLPTGKYSLGTFSMETEKKLYPAGLLGYFQPVGKNIVVGVGAYTLSGLGADWVNPGLEAALVYPYPPAAFTPTLGAYDWRSFIGSVTIAPSIAVKLSDMLFIGASLNINYGFFQTDQWGQFVVVTPTAPPAGGIVAAAPTLINLGQQSLNVKGWGLGATFGVKIKPADWINIGATFRTESKISLKGTMEFDNIGLLGLADSSDASMKVPSPMWLAGGVSVKPVAGLTLAADAQYTNWSKLQAIAITFTDPAWAVALADEAALVLDWKNKTQFRFGAEYDFGSFAIRGGYYFDPAPTPDETLNILTPSFSFNSFAFGIGYKTGGLRLDAAVEYLTAKTRTITSMSAAMPGIYDEKVVCPTIGLSYAF